jgi:hypothetical protein
VYERPSPLLAQREKLAPVDVSALDQKRIEYLSSLFEKNGASLALDRGRDGSWQASVAESGSSVVRVEEVRCWTAVEAAEVAWLRFRAQVERAEEAHA